MTGTTYTYADQIRRQPQEAPAPSSQPRSLQREIATHVDASLGRVFEAAILRESATAAIAEMAVDAYIAASRHDSFPPDPSYSLLEDERVGSNTGLLELLSGSRSRAETTWRLQELYRERERQAVLNGNPLAGLGGTGLALILDPVGLPMASIRGVRGLAAVVGGAGAQEVVLHQADHTRTLAESGTAIAATGVLAAPFAMRGTADRARAVEDLYRGVEEGVSGRATVVGDDGVTRVDPETGMPLDEPPSAAGAASRDEAQADDEAGAAGERTSIFGDEMPDRPASVRLEELGEGAPAASSRIVDDEGPDLFAREEDLVTTGTGLERGRWNPILRLMAVDSGEVRNLVPRLADLGGMIQNKNYLGLSTPQSVTSRWRSRWLASYAQTRRGVDEAYVEMLGARAGAVPNWTAWRLSIQRRNDQTVMGLSEFRARVGQALRRGDVDAYGNEFVTRAAQKVRADVLNPLRDEALNTGLFQKVAEDEIVRLEKQIARMEKALTAAKRGGASADEIAEMQRKKARLDDTYVKAESRYEAILAGKLDTTTAKSYFPRVYRHDRIMDDRPRFEGIIADWLVRGGARADEAATTAKDIVDDILQDRPFIPFDADQTGVAGAARGRSLDIPDSLIEEFLVDDVDVVLSSHVRSLGTDIELMREFGEVDLRMTLEKIEQDLAKRGITGGKAKEILDDIRAMRDLVRGNYGLPKDPYRLTSRAIRMAKVWNFLTLITGAISAFTDLARGTMTEGLDRGLGRPLRTLVRDFEAIQLGAKETRLAGEALDFELGLTAMQMVDASDAMYKRTKVERNLWGASVFFATFVNGLNVWNGAVKSVTGAIVGSRIAEESLNWTRGTISQMEQIKLARSGIGKFHAEQIAEQVQIHGRIRKDGQMWRLDDPDAPKDGMIIANTAEWDNPVAVEVYRAALNKDVQRAIVTPSEGEGPLWTSTEWGSLITQFLRFGMSSMHKVLISGLQERSMNFYLGAAMMVGMGMVSDELKRRLRGDDRELSFKTRLQRGVLQSGVFGALTDVTAASEAALDLFREPTLGGKLEALGDLGGPTAGRVEGTARMAANFLQGEMSGRDEYVAKTWLPGAQIPWFQAISRQVAGEDRP